MGTTSSRNSLAEFKQCTQRFDARELKVLKETFKDLAQRSPGNTIDKHTFLKFFPLPGMLGERLFAVFDKKGTQNIDFEEFLVGVAIACRGTQAEKMRFIFTLHDLTGDDLVSRAELRTMLSHIPASALGAADESGSNHVEEIVENAFAASGVGADGSMSFSQFQRFLEGAPALYQFLDVMLPYDAASLVPNFDPGAATPRKGPERAGPAPDVLRIQSSPAGPAGTGRPLVSSPRLSGRIMARPSVIASPGVRRPLSAPVAQVESTTPPCSPAKAPSRSEARSSGVVAPDGSGLEPQTAMHTEPAAEKKEAPVDSTEHPPSPLVLSSFPESSPPPLSDAAMEGSTGGDVGTQGPVQVTPHLRVRSGSWERFRAQTRAPQGGLHRSWQLVCTGCQAEFRHCFACGGRFRPNVSAAFDAEKGGWWITCHTCDVAIVTGFCSSCGGVRTASDVSVRLERSQQLFEMEGSLWKRGRHLSGWQQRWYYLRNNILYYYSGPREVVPRGVIFVDACTVDPIDDEHRGKGFYGFALIPNRTGGDRDRRLLYAKSREDRNHWVASLRMATTQQPLKDVYKIGRELGVGKFSTVCECTKRDTDEKFAVKIIDKSVMKEQERELMRTEIAVLKLVRHPNIIRMIDVFETRDKIFIVMELLEGGELYDRIVGRPRFTEDEARRLLKPLISSVSYLHQLGIVHRDIKPENILCGEHLHDIKIADFGLSKMVVPEEVMNMPCGTLTYVAPEVLAMKGYGMAADLWSVGCLTHLILRGKLPFDSDDRNEIINSTIKDPVKLSDDIWMGMSDGVRDFVNKLLAKDPAARPTAQQALQHPWLADEPVTPMPGDV